MNKCAVCSRQTSNPKCCSRECSSKVWAIQGRKAWQAKEKVVNQKTCERLGCQNFHSNKQYCSVACSNSGTPRRASKPKKMKTYPCLVNLDTNKCTRFCSATCRAKFRFEEIYTIAIDTGQVPKGNNWARRVLTRRDGHICTICLRSSWEGDPIDLTVDHINGKSWEHVLSNLRLICSNCDRKLPTFGSRNIGNGRAYRRLRYAEGKSS